MPILETQNLPNQKPQPSVESMASQEFATDSKSLQDEFNLIYQQAYQTTPEKNRDQVLGQLHMQYQKEFADRQNRSNLQMQRFKEVDNLVSSGNIPVSDAPRIKMQLFRPELAREMYKPPSKPDAAFSENQKNDYAKAAQTFIENIPLQGNWLTGRTAALPDIMSMYTQWKRDIAYEVKDPTQQRQLDDVWDSMMQSDSVLKDKWFEYDKGGNQYVVSPIRAERARFWAGGPAAKAVADRKSSLPVSPIGSVIKSMKTPEQPTEIITPEEYRKQMSDISWGRWYPNAREPERSTKQLDAQTAMQIMTEAGGNKDKAREIAKKKGYAL